MAYDYNGDYYDDSNEGYWICLKCKRKYPNEWKAISPKSGNIVPSLQCNCGNVAYGTNNFFKHFDYIKYEDEEEHDENE